MTEDSQEAPGSESVIITDSPEIADQAAENAADLSGQDSAAGDNSEQNSSEDSSTAEDGIIVETVTGSGGESSVSHAPAMEAAIDETGETDPETEVASEQIAAPTFNTSAVVYSVEGYHTSGNITLSREIPEGVTVQTKYTLNGTDPSAANGTNYTRNITFANVRKGTIGADGYITLKAINIVTGGDMVDSEIAELKIKLAPSDMVIFKDIALKRAVFEALDLEGDPQTDTISQSQMAGLKELTAENAGITDLSGLEYAKNIEVLDLSGNDLSSSFNTFVTGVSRQTYRYPALRSIDLSNCGIPYNATFSIAVFGSPAIEDVDFHGNDMRGCFDITTVSKAELSALKRIDLSDNDLFGISNSNNGTFPVLEKIDLSKNRVYPDENGGNWFSDAVKIGINQFDFSDQKDLTELYQYVLKVGSKKAATVLFDNETNVIDLGQILDTSITLTLQGYGELRTMSGKIDGRDLPVMIGSPVNTTGCSSEYELETGENEIKVLLTHVSGGTRTITIKAKVLGVPGEEGEENAGIMDRYLHQTVVEALNKLSDYDVDEASYVIKKADMERLTSLTIPQKAVDLSGLEYAANLTSLTFYPTGAVDVSAWPNLTRLSLQGGKFTSLTGLEGLTKLTQLTLTGAFEEINIPDEVLGNLTMLDVESDNLVTAPDLSKAAGLTSLYVSVAKNHTAPDLSAMTNLTQVKYYNPDDFAYKCETELPKLASVIYQFDGSAAFSLAGIRSAKRLRYYIIATNATGSGTVSVDVSDASADDCYLEVTNSYLANVPDTDFILTGQNDHLTEINFGMGAKSISFSDDFRAGNVKTLTLGDSNTAVGDIHLESKESFPTVENLKIWNITSMTKLPTGINGMTALRTADLRWCRAVESIDNIDLTALTSLESLAIASFSSLGGTLDGSILPTNLKTLNLAYDGFEGLTGNWKEMPNLTSLDMGGNRFDEFPTAAVRAAVNAQTINLIGNFYETIPEDAFENNAALASLTLGNWLPGKISGASTMQGYPMSAPLDGTTAAIAIERLKERLPGCKVAIWGGPNLDDPNGSYSTLKRLESSEGTVSANLMSERSLTLRVPAGTEKVTLTPYALLTDSKISVNGKTVASGDAVEVSLPAMETTVTITCENEYTKSLNETIGDGMEDPVVYNLNIVAASYIEEFEPEDSHWYNVEYILRKADQSVSMADNYFDHVALIKVDETNEQGKYEVRFNTTSKSFINDMRYASSDGVERQADLIAQDGEYATYRIYVDDLENPITVTPRVAPMGDVYVSCWMHLDKTRAIDMTANIGADKAELGKTIANAQAIVDAVAESRNVYTEDSYAALESALAEAKEIDALSAPQQVAVDKAGKALADAIDALVIDESKLADKTSLEEALAAAKALEKGSHTDTNWEALQEAIADAQEVYDDLYATTKEAAAAVKALNNAIKSFNSSGEASTLDRENLADGQYSVYVDMMNASNPAQKSMSDGAVTKPVTLTAKDGNYSITANFHGIYITLAGTSFFGYMKELSYWDGSAGADGTGGYMPVTVDSTYDKVDTYNDADGDGKADYLYPHQMTFPLVNKAAGDDENGFVHVQVFVPIMEAMSAGTGTQQALMKIDWSSLKKGAEDAERAQQKEAAVNALNSTVADAKNTSNASGTYTAESYAALQEAIKAAEALAKDPNATKAQLEAAQKAIQDAKNNLKKASGSTGSNTGSGTQAAKVEAGKTYTVGGQSYKVTKVAAGSTAGTVTFTKAKNAKNVTVPATVKLADGKTYKVTQIGAKAFTGKKIKKVTVGANVTKLAKNAFAKSKAKTVVLKTKSLKKAGVKGALKGSKVKKIQVKAGSKKVNKKLIKSYKKIFTKKIAGKKVSVK